MTYLLSENASADKKKKQKQKNKKQTNKEKLFLVSRVLSEAD